MYLYIRGIDFAFSTILIFDFEIDPTVWYYLSFNLSVNILYLMYRHVLTQLIIEIYKDGQFHKRISKWFLFNAKCKWSIFQLYHLTWDDNYVRFVLDQHLQWDFNSACLLKQQCKDYYVVALGHIILLPSQPTVFLLLNTAYLGEKHQIPS